MLTIERIVTDRGHGVCLSVSILYRFRNDEREGNRVSRIGDYTCLSVRIDSVHKLAVSNLIGGDSREGENCREKQ